MTNSSRYWPALLCAPLALASPQQAQAIETIDFENTGCKTDSSTLCRLPDTYGDTDKVDISYARVNPLTGARLDGLYRYGVGYGDLSGVVFAVRGHEYAGEVMLAAVPGYQLSLLSFDFASFAGRFPTVPLLVTDLLGTEIFTGTRSTGGPSHGSLAVNSAFGDGFIIRFGPNAYDVGLDNIRYEVKAVAGAIPEPGTWALMILGFGLVGASMRHNRSARMAFT